MAQGINLAVGPAGELYAVWASYDQFPATETGIWFCTSFDGGDTFSSPVRISGAYFTGIRGNLKSASFCGVRVASFPVMAVDTSHGPFQGTIYVVWADGRNGNPDIYLTKLPYGQGATWSSPIRVNDDNTSTDQWEPWISVDPNGLVHVVFYDSRVEPANNWLTAIYMATSWDGGNSFANCLISDTAFTPSPVRGDYMGDYIGITSDQCAAYPCWNDNRSGIHQAYMARVPFIPGDVDGSGVIDVIDVVKTIEVAFRGSLCVPIHQALVDLDANGVIDILDVVRVISYAFRGQPTPAACIFDLSHNAYPSCCPMGCPPMLRAPRNDSTGLPSQVVLTWDAIPGVATYWLQIDTAEEFSSPVKIVDDHTIQTSTDTTSGLTPGRAYYWRVCVYRQSCNSPNWSAAFKFTTGSQ
ncbi:MAG: hypothetical protein HY304_04310 [candidate division Zixibacteria bacterium]|nr:hypothetical protein [candidate division Zixibacteria bacterium]